MAINVSLFNFGALNKTQFSGGRNFPTNFYRSSSGRPIVKIVSEWAAKSFYKGTPTFLTVPTESHKISSKFSLTSGAAGSFSILLMVFSATTISTKKYMYIAITKNLSHVTTDTFKCTM